MISRSASAPGFYQACRSARQRQFRCPAESQSSYAAWLVAQRNEAGGPWSKWILVVLWFWFQIRTDDRLWFLKQSFGQAHGTVLVQAGLRTSTLHPLHKTLPPPRSCHQVALVFYWQTSAVSWKEFYSATWHVFPHQRLTDSCTAAGRHMPIRSLCD